MRFYRLNSLKDKPIKVRVLDVSKKDNKLIVSKRAEDELQNRFSKLKVGDTIEGVITGSLISGAFVNVDGMERLDPYFRDFLGTGSRIERLCENWTRITAKIIEHR